MIHWQLLASQVVAAVVWGSFTEWEIGQNAQAIDQNGSQDTLKQGFHERRSWVRGLWFGGCCLGGSLWANSWGTWALSVLALVLLLGAYFVRTFNPRLNVARASAWVGRFYVSFAPGAAGWPDRFLARLAVKRHPMDLVAQRDWAQQALQNLLNACLLLGILSWLACDAWALRV